MCSTRIETPESNLRQTRKARPHTPYPNPWRVTRQVDESVQRAGHGRDLFQQMLAAERVRSGGDNRGHTLSLGDRPEPREQCWKTADAFAAKQTQRSV